MKCRQRSVCDGKNKPKPYSLHLTTWSRSWQKKGHQLGRYNSSMKNKSLSGPKQPREWFIHSLGLKSAVAPSYLFIVMEIAEICNMQCKINRFKYFVCALLLTRISEVVTIAPQFVKWGIKNFKWFPWNVHPLCDRITSSESVLQTYSITDVLTPYLNAQHGV